MRRLIIFAAFLATCAFAQPKVVPDREAGMKADIAEIGRAHV